MTGLLKLFGRRTAINKPKGLIAGLYGQRQCWLIKCCLADKASQGWPAFRKAMG